MPVLDSPPMSTPSGGRKRGRPSAPPGSSLGNYLRELRLARSWTIRDLARAVGLPASSAGYLSQMEAGAKVPNVALAGKLAEQLGDPRAVFPLWAEIGGRKDPHSSALARRELARILEDPSLMFDPRFLNPGSTRYERYRELQRLEDGLAVETAQFEETSRRSANRTMSGGYRVPILPEGADPDTARALFLGSAERPEVEFVRISGEALGSKKLHLPFAYRMTETSVRRVGSVLRPGDVVVFSQEQVPIVEHEIYAIRHDRRVELAHAMWNDAHLLLLPNTGKSDFLILPARTEDDLAKLVAGHMVTTLRTPA